MLGIGIVSAVVRGIRSAWNPRTTLFGNSEVGAWYDPSDYSTLFQDSAGTTPVTAVEQPVGLMLDKSKGLVLGTELVTNGTFDDGTTGWAASPGATLALDSAVIAGGAKITSAGVGSLVSFELSGLVAGKTYTAYVRLYLPSSNTVNSCATFSLIGLHDSGRKNIPSNSIQTVTYCFTATLPNATLAVTMVNPGVAWSAAGDVVYIDDLSVRELPGNHASQATSTARPVLSARVNLLTYTETFASDWTTTSSLLSASAVTPPAMAQSAVKFTKPVGGGFESVYRYLNFTAASQTWSVVAKAAEWQYLGLYLQNPDRFVYFNLATGSVGNVAAGCTATIESFGDGWYRCSMTGAANGTNAPSLFATNVDNSYTPTGDGVSGIYVTAAQLELGSTATRYQRVNTATDYDAVGFPKLANYDSVDDVMNTTFASALGSNCTVARAVGGGPPVILTGQTIGTSYADTTDHAGLIIIDRALTASETASLTAYLTAKGAS